MDLIGFSLTKKEGISRTYKGYDGYAPIMAYIGSESYFIKTELREGKQHCQCHTPSFLKKTIDFSDEDVISAYHAHGECEQYHSEIKTDMDIERLPSGKFETNELMLELTILAYNILRMIGQESIGRKGTRQKRAVKRRRLRTVIRNLIKLAILSCFFKVLK